MIQQKASPMQWPSRQMIQQQGFFDAMGMQPNASIKGSDAMDRRTNDSTKGFSYAMDRHANDSTKVFSDAMDMQTTDSTKDFSDATKRLLRCNGHADE